MAVLGPVLFVEQALMAVEVIAVSAARTRAGLSVRQLAC
jgi:hypothetical protein